MKKFRLLVLFVLVAMSPGVAQDQTSAGNTQSVTASLNPDVQPTAIRILTPVAGQTLTADSVDLRLELAQPAASAEPNFLLQLDSADPISTISTDYTFPELLPGPHAIRVTLVDANNSPVQGGSATVQFKVPQPAHNESLHSTRPRPLATITGAAPAAPIPPELRNDGDLNLPLAGSPLPMLSLIGFGLLIGGAAQSMRKR